jgi:hypothetical protein
VFCTVAGLPLKWQNGVCCFCFYCSHTLLTLSEQKGGVPKLFLEAYDQYRGTYADDNPHPTANPYLSLLFQLCCSSCHLEVVMHEPGHSLMELHFHTEQLLVQWLVVVVVVVGGGGGVVKATSVSAAAEEANKR